jgi:peptide/nickel transport system permease protein
MAFLQPSIVNIMIIIGLTGWPGIARLMRGEFLRLRGQEFVLAARALGASDPRIMLRHILPNGLGPIFVAATFGIAGAILTESALSFLGFGVPQPTASWGDILNNGRNDIYGSWWLTVFPGIAIFLTVTSFNLIGESLRDILDPRLRGMFRRKPV